MVYAEIPMTCRRQGIGISANLQLLPKRSDLISGGKFFIYRIIPQFVQAIRLFCRVQGERIVQAEAKAEFGDGKFGCGRQTFGDTIGFNNNLLFFRFRRLGVKVDILIFF